MEENKVMNNPSYHGNKEYQTLFWVPMLFQSAKNAENIIEDMLEMISDFNSLEDHKPTVRRSILDRKANTNVVHKRRQQIFGEVLDSEVVTTRVDVVLKSEATKVTLLSVLKQHFLFCQRSDYELEDAIDVMQSLYVEEDEIIIEQGESGELFYIIEEGECEIIKDGETVGILREKSWFGDLALMYNCPRSATVRAITNCTLWTLDRVFFRQAMMTSSSNQNVQLSQFLSKISLFENLGIQSLNQLARSLTKQSYEDGQYIIRQGDLGDQFFIVYKGKVKVSKTDDRGVERFLLHLDAGEVFGEKALIKKEPRKANIIADGLVECVYLESKDFYNMLGSVVDKFTKLDHFRTIRLVGLFTKINDQRLKDLIHKLTFHRLFSGQRIVCNQREMYLAMDGQFVSSFGQKYANDGIIDIGTRERGADELAGALTVLSEEGLLGSLSLEVLEEYIKKSEEDEKMHHRGFKSPGNPSFSTRNSLLGHTNSALSHSGGQVSGPTTTTETEPDFEKELSAASERRKASALARQKVLGPYLISSLQNLEVNCPLGIGTFGSVFLGQQISNGRDVAIKCLDKKALVESEQYPYITREVNALKTFQHPFIAEYYGSVLSPRKIFLFLEFIPGGELWNYIYHPEKSGRTIGPYGGIPLQDAALYGGIILCALEHIHHLGYSYRDLKPENLLLHSNGYIKLVDFGFAKQVPFINKNQQIFYRTYTLCGTPDYMAPELVLTQGHDKSVDYWAFGILLYELICGMTPFESSNQQRTFEKIVHSHKHLTFPNQFDPHGKSLIRRLLHPNSALRLGALQNGFDDIKKHAFFDSFSMNFDQLLQQTVPMPYIPQPFHFREVHTNEEQKKIEMIDLQFEMNIHVENDYNSIFKNICDDGIGE